MTPEPFGDGVDVLMCRSRSSVRSSFLVTRGGRLFGGVTPKRLENTVQTSQLKSLTVPLSERTVGGHVRRSTRPYRYVLH